MPREPESAPDAGAAEQQQWLDRIRQYLIANLAIDRQECQDLPILHDAGGWGRANRVFGGELEQVVEALNEAMAAWRGRHAWQGSKRGSDPFSPFPNARWFP